MKTIVSRTILIVLSLMIVLMAMACASTNPDQPPEDLSIGQSGEAPTSTSVDPADPTTSVDESVDRLHVVTSFYPMFDFALKIGGDRIEAINLVPAGAEPHSWEPAAADLVALEKADVFIYNGADMEHWVDFVLAAVRNETLVVVETTANIDLLAGHDHDHDDNHDDDHDTAAEENDLHTQESETDPHVWLDPLLAAQQMETIRDAFIEADPDHATYYEANYNQVYEQLLQLDKEMHDGLADLASRDLIVAHAAYGYLATAYDLNQIPISGLSPEQEPNPARMAEIIDLARAREIRVIFFEELVSPKVAEVIAEAIGAETAILSPLGGLTDDQLAAGDDYFSIMRQNLEIIRSALGHQEDRP